MASKRQRRQNRKNPKSRKQKETPQAQNRQTLPEVDEPIPLVDLPEDSLQELRSRLHERLNQKNATQTVIGNTPSETKLSEFVLTMVERHLDPDHPDFMEGIVTAAISAWNAEIHLQEEKEQLNERLKTIVSAPERESIVGAFERLIRKKHELFPDDLRTIDEWEIRFTEENMELLAANMGKVRKSKSGDQ